MRIRVIKGRQLQGGNLDAACRITVFNQSKQTKIKKSTNSPYWDELFFFNFSNSPDEFLKGIIDFQVFHSKKIRSDSLVGDFKV